jgi:hypothetical protein
MIQIAVINGSTAIDDSQMPAVVAALQRQVHEHFAPIWGIDAELTFLAKGAQARGEEWQLVLLDDSDQAEALGYHETTVSGLPLGKVFARTTTEDGAAWPLVASHELLEMLADPEINLTVFAQDQNDTGGRLYAYEVCDPVEGASYLIDTIPVSDFVCPAYFEAATGTATPGAPFDYLTQLDRPLPAMLPGGYLCVFEIGARGANGWTQLTDMRAASTRMKPARGSRRHRRMTPRARWRRSTR